MNVHTRLILHVAFNVHTACSLDFQHIFFLFFWSVIFFLALIFFNVTLNYYLSCCSNIRHKFQQLVNRLLFFPPTSYHKYELVFLSKMFSREIEIDFLVCCNTVSLILTPALGIEANLFWCFGGPYQLLFFFFNGLFFLVTKQEKSYNYFTFYLSHKTQIFLLSDF